MFYNNKAVDRNPWLFFDPPAFAVGSFSVRCRGITGLRPLISCTLPQLVILFTSLLPVGHRLQRLLESGCDGAAPAAATLMLVVWVEVWWSEPVSVQERMGVLRNGEWCKMSTKAGRAWLRDSPVRQILTPRESCQKAFYGRILFSLRVEFLSQFGF